MKRFFTLVLPVALLLLSGCATVNETKPAIPATLSPGDGVVMVKVIGVQPLSAFNAKWRSLTLEEETTGRKLTMQDIGPINAGYSLFAGPVPQGKYRVSAFDSTGPAPASLGILPALVISAMTSDGASMGAQLGSFTVTPGALNNLGVIVSALPASKNESMQIAVLSDAQAQSSTLSDVDLPTRERAQSMVLRAWDRPHDPAAASRALEIVRTRASNVSSLAVTEDQRIMIGSALGMVHALSLNGQWSLMSTGSLDNITYLRSLSGGRIFAATDSGRYFVWLPTENKWNPGLVAGGERILHLEPMGALGFALLTQEPLRADSPITLKQRLLFKQDLVDPAEAKELIPLPGFSATGKLPLFFNDSELWAAFNHIGISRTADLYRIDPQSFAVKTEKLDHWVRDFYRPAQELLVKERMNGMSVYSDFSSDAGLTWARNETSGPYVMRFLNKELGYGLSVLSTGWSTVTLTLSKTVNGGKEWVRVGTPVESSGPSQIRVVGDRVFIYTGRQLISTQDDGKTWRVEWPLSDAVASQAAQAQALIGAPSNR